MKLLDSGHLPSCLGNLETVADQNGPAVHAHDAGVEPEDQSAPDASELAQIQGRTVEEVQQRVVTSRLQTQGCAGLPHGQADYQADSLSGRGDQLRSAGAQPLE